MEGEGVYVPGWGWGNRHRKRERESARAHACVCVCGGGEIRDAARGENSKRLGMRNIAGRRQIVKELVGMGKGVEGSGTWGLKERPQHRCEDGDGVGGKERKEQLLHCRGKHNRWEITV